MSYKALDGECAGVLSDPECSTGAAADPVHAVVSQTPRIRWVDEAQAASMIRCDEVGSETVFAAELGATRSRDERARLVRSVLHILGFQNLAYLTVGIDHRGAVDLAYVLRDYLSSNLIQRMLHTRFLERSVPLRAALTSHLPQRWELRTLMGGHRSREFIEQDRRLLDEMRENGLCSGLVFGLPIADTSMRSIVIFASSREAAGDWFTDSILVQSLALGLSVHQRCAAYVRAAQRSEALGSLSAAHRRIVDLLVLGLSDKEIALRLDMTSFNVDYHLRQLKERYGALNRSHLAFIAGSARSFSPRAGDEPA